MVQSTQIQWCNENRYTYEETTVNKLRNEIFVTALYEVGVIADKYNRHIDVSPDGIAILKLESENEDEVES